MHTSACPAVVMKVFWFVFVATFVGVSSNDGNVLERLKSGFEFAGNLFKVDQIRDVTKLVSDAFKKGSENVEQKKSDDVFSTFLRILGFDTKKIGAITINSLIFLAQLVSLNEIFVVNLNNKKAFHLNKKYRR